MHQPFRIELPFAAMLIAALAAAPNLQAGEDAALIRRFEEGIRAELQRGAISGVSVALVEDQRTIFAGGFGYADKKRRVPASRETIYRAGSISKLFTALATMQLAEQGRLKIDAPVTQYLPALGIVSPFENAAPMTLRQLMCHRSGMVREAPVGGYLDDAQAGTTKTVASLSGCALVYPPGTRTKYSNSGVTIAGHVIETVSGQAFEEYQGRHWLGPIGMRSSAFRMNGTLRPRLAKGYLPVADGHGGFREIESPAFELGTIPAGNLYTTAEDLARFLSFLFAEGNAGGGQLIQNTTLAEMFTPQLTKETNGFGLGFSVGAFRGHKTISHMGAVYGFTSMVIGVPRHKLGVVVLCNDDIVTAATRRLALNALGAMLEAKTGEPAPPSKPRIDLEAAALAAFAGEYESESWWAELKVAGRGLEMNLSGQRMTLAPVEPLQFEANGRLAWDAPMTFERDTAGVVTGFTALGQKFRRASQPANASIPPEWKKFLGVYGPAFIPLIVSARHGHLYAMVENEYDNRLTPLNRTVFKMPPGMYVDEQLVFQPDARGKVHTAVLANMPLARH